jgi:hypothetical protein
LLMFSLLLLLSSVLFFVCFSFLFCLC